MSRKNRLQLIVACVLFCLLFVYWAVWVRAPLTAEPDSNQPICRLFGDFKDAMNRVDGSNFESLSGMVRLSFSAESVHRCKEMAMSYCGNRFAEGYKPGIVHLSFRQSPDDSEEIQFRVTQNCTISESE